MLATAEVGQRFNTAQLQQFGHELCEKKYGISGL